MIARVLLCSLLLTAAVTAAPLLSIDFDCRTNVQTQPGFSSFLITSNISASTSQTNATMRTFGSYRVTLSGSGLNRGYLDRSRELPVNQAAFTESQLLQDCVWSSDTTTNGGLNVLIENLPPTNRLLITIWSFDEASPPVRASDWYANDLLVRRAYQFTNSVMPIRNDQYRLSFTAIVSPSGQLLIEGRRNAMSTNTIGNTWPAVFLNALQIDPEPLEILTVVTNGNELRLTFVIRPQPGTYVIEETAGGAWTTTSGVIYGTPANNRVTARFPRPAQTRLYRIRYNH
jgi:hypothetical protein